MQWRGETCHRALEFNSTGRWGRGEGAVGRFSFVALVEGDPSGGRKGRRWVRKSNGMLVCLLVYLIKGERHPRSAPKEGQAHPKKTKSAAKEIVQSKRLLCSVTFHFRFGLKFGLAVLKIIVPACVVFPSLPGMHVLAQLCRCKTAADSNSANAQRYDEIVLVGIVHVWTRKRASPVRENIHPTISFHCIVVILC